MDKYKNYTRFSNPQLKHKQSEAGYQLYISNEAQKQLDQLSGHTKTRAYQTIQSLASDPYPGKTDGRLCVRSKSSADYLVAHDIAVKFVRKPEDVLIEAVKPHSPQHTSCGTASAENTIGALKQELHHLNSISPKDFGTMCKMAGFSGDPGLELVELKSTITREIAKLTTNGASAAINDTPVETAASAFGAVASTAEGKVAKVGLIANVWASYRAGKTLYSISKLFGDHDVQYEAGYICRSYCKLDILVKD